MEPKVQLLCSQRRITGSCSELVQFEPPPRLPADLCEHEVVFRSAPTRNRPCGFLRSCFSTLYVYDVLTSSVRGTYPSHLFVGTIAISVFCVRPCDTIDATSPYTVCTR